MRRRGRAKGEMFISFGGVEFLEVLQRVTQPSTSCRLSKLCCHLYIIACNQLKSPFSLLAFVCYLIVSVLFELCAILFLMDS